MFLPLSVNLLQVITKRRAEGLLGETSSSPLPNAPGHRSSWWPNSASQGGRRMRILLILAILLIIMVTRCENMFWRLILQHSLYLATIHADGSGN